MHQIINLHCSTSGGLRLTSTAEGLVREWDDTSQAWKMVLRPHVKRYIKFSPYVDVGMVPSATDARVGGAAKVTLEWKEENGEISDEDYGEGFFTLLGVIKHDYFITNSWKLRPTRLVIHHTNKKSMTVFIESCRLPVDGNLDRFHPSILPG